MTDEEVSKAMLENLNLKIPPRQREGRMDFMDDETKRVFKAAHSAITEAIAEKDKELFERMKNKIQTAIELRDRATQVALNFAGQRISSSDGSYELLIELIHSELVVAASDARAEERAIWTEVVEKYVHPKYLAKNIIRNRLADLNAKPHESPSDNEPNVDIEDKPQYEK